MRKLFFQIGAAVFIMVFVVGYYWFPALSLLFILVPVFILGILDVTQTHHTLRRNFPVLGHGRYLLEIIRPEINQYFVESNTDGRPFNREQRSVVYQRAKNSIDTLPFGTQLNVYADDYEWINHSLAPKKILHKEPRVLVGGKDCRQPYAASVFNISAMSYGSLSQTAVLALNKGGKMGGFAHNTGEGGLSPYHLEHGGDLIWQIGTGYFSCRNKDGTFNTDEFKKRALLPNVKMIEIKLSQGAKPGHGGILPAKKVTREISEIRGVEMGKDVLSPPAHSAFSTPTGLLEFVARLRDFSGGKPVGFKLCLGKHREFMAIAKAMIKTGILPDFITVDGGEGGTGAAPVEFSNSVGTPLNDGLHYVHSVLVGIGVRDKIRVIASGKVTTGFAIAAKMALGADMCNSARGMLFALGCIQALRCNTNTCPAGVTTQDPDLYNGLHIGDKSVRVWNFHKNTVHSFLEVLGAAGLSHPSQIRPWHIMKRISPGEVKNYDDIYAGIEPNGLVDGSYPEKYRRAWTQADPDSF